MARKVIKEQEKKKELLPRGRVTKRIDIATGKELPLEGRPPTGAEGQVFERADVTGDPGGITFDGKTFLGLSPADVAEIQRRKGLEQVPEEMAQRQQQEQLLESQEAIVERERLEREGVELPPGEQPPITEQALAEPEKKGVFEQIGDVYDFVDRLGGLIPDWEEQGKDVQQGTLPITLGGGVIGGVKKGKAILNTAKSKNFVRATKSFKGVRTAFSKKWVQKLGKYGLIAYGLWSERTMQNIDSALSQVRETLTLPVSLAAANPNRVNEAFDMITEFEDDINEYERDLKVREPFALTALVSGRTRPIYQRIRKLRVAVTLAREQIAKTEAGGIALNDEETGLLMNDMNKLLNSMDDPIKFLGVI